MATKKAASKAEGRAARPKTSAGAATKRAAKKTSSRPAAAKKTAPRKSAATATRSRAAVSGARQASKDTAASKRSAAKTPTKRVASKKTSTDDKYTDPALRDRIKERIVRGDKGGRAGQWSARKAQMVAHEYEAEGGGYKGGRDETQKSLTAWGDEHWTTQDGKPARQGDSMHRYLPAEAWKHLSPAEKRSTEKKKRAGDKAGKQFVANTGAAVKARRSAEKKS